MQNTADEGADSISPAMGRSLSKSTDLFHINVLYLRLKTQGAQNTSPLSLSTKALPLTKPPGSPASRGGEMEAG